MTHLVTVPAYGPEQRAWVSQHCAGAVEVLAKPGPDPRYEITDHGSWGLKDEHHMAVVEKVMTGYAGQFDHDQILRGVRELRTARQPTRQDYEIAFELEEDAVAFSVRFG